MIVKMFSLLLIGMSFCSPIDFEKTKSREIIAMNFVVNNLSRDTMNLRKPHEIGLNDFNFKLWNMLFKYDVKFFSDYCIYSNSLDEKETSIKLINFYKVDKVQNIDLVKNLEIENVRRDFFLTSLCDDKNLFLFPNRAVKLGKYYLVDIYFSNCENLSENQYLGIKVFFKGKKVIGWKYFMRADF